MKFVLIQLKECLSQTEIEEAETRARACGIPLDEWLTMVLKAAIRNPEARLISAATEEEGRAPDRPEDTSEPQQLKKDPEPLRRNRGQGRKRL